MEPAEVQVVGSIQLLSVLTSLVTTPGVLFHPDVHLYQNNIVPNRSTLIGDLTEADFTGYAKVTAMVWGTPYYDVDGSALCFGTSHSFVATDAVAPNTIYGYYLTDSADAVLLATYPLASPVGIPGAGSGITVLPTYRYSGD